MARWCVYNICLYTLIWLCNQHLMVSSILMTTWYKLYWHVHYKENNNNDSNQFIFELNESLARCYFIASTFSVLLFVTFHQVKISVLVLIWHCLKWLVFNCNHWHVVSGAADINTLYSWCRRTMLVYFKAFFTWSSRMLQVILDISILMCLSDHWWDFTTLLIDSWEYNHFPQEKIKWTSKWYCEA